eukprot:TRINITY_DN929_c0_g1_i2.p1 TRINITY_DN929_c0_g1~~TRINITY_DN929_c0_g1_i2.p1  ORF type:complete len:924 (-),score=219.89 TRINITY_DN929_c0_g1_i2:36-2807(-)
MRHSSLLAANTIMQLFDQPDDVKNIVPFVPVLAKRVICSLQQGNQQDAHEILGTFIELVPAAPQIFLPHFRLMLQLVCTVATLTYEIDDGLKFAALEILAELCETHKTALRKDTEFLRDTTFLCFQLLARVQEEQLWFTVPNEGSELTISDVAEGTLDRVALAIGGKALVPVLFPFLPQLAQSTAWQQRYAAAAAIRACGEGCKFVLKSHLLELLNFVEVLTHDAHYGVRCSALSCLTQMCADFRPKLQKKFTSGFIQLALQNSFDSNTRVQARACSMLNSFCEVVCGVAYTAFASHLDVIVKRLRQLLDSKDLCVREEAVSCVSSIVYSAAKHFGPYYDVFMPPLKAMVVDSNVRRVIREKALECLSLVGLSVDKAKFAPDAKDIINIFLKTPDTVRTIDIFARFAEALQKDFAPFLKDTHVLEPLMKQASVTVDVSEILGADGTIDLTKETSQKLEDKCAALRSILVIAEKTEEFFFPYIEETAKLVSASFNFPLSEDVRAIAAAGSVTLLRCKLAHLREPAATTSFLCAFHPRCGQYSRFRSLPEGVAQEVIGILRANIDYSNVLLVWRDMFFALASNMMNESNLLVLATQFDAIKECVEVLKGQAMTQEMCLVFFDLAKKVLLEWLERRQLLCDAQKECDAEEKASMKDEKEDEDDLLQILVLCLQRVGQYHPKQYNASFVTQIMYSATFMVEARRSTHEQLHGIMLLVDFVENVGVGCKHHLSTIIKLLLRHALSKSVNVAQPALFGIGICAQHTGELFKPFISESIAYLLEASLGERKGKHAFRTDNAIAALVRIVRYQYHHVDHSTLTTLTPVWLGYLPITADLGEAASCSDTLCHFLERPTTAATVFGRDFALLPRALEVLMRADAGHGGVALADDRVRARLRAVLLAMHQGTSCVPAAISRAAWDTAKASFCAS